jgi:engulfment and cell motility protein 1
MKHLHFMDSAVKMPVRGGLDDLPERSRHSNLTLLTEIHLTNETRILLTVEIAAIAEVTTGTCVMPSNILGSIAPHEQPSLGAPSPLSFSLLSIREGSLADQIAESPSQFADWTDGLNMLRRDGGHVSTQETAGYIQALTEIGLKIKLLGMVKVSLHARPSLTLCFDLRSLRRES